MFRQHVLCFGLYSLLLVLSSNTIEKSLALSSSRPSIRYLYTLLDPPQVIFSLGYAVLPQPFLLHIHTLNSFGWPAYSHRQMEQRCSLHLGPQFSSIATRKTLHRNGLQCVLLLTNIPSFDFKKLWTRGTSGVQFCTCWTDRNMAPVSVMEYR